MLDEFRRHHGLTIFANDTFRSWKLGLDDLVVECRNKGGVPRALADVVAPGKADVVLLKPRHSAFYGTALEFIREEHKVETLVLAGIAADFCIAFTALDAFVRGYRLWVPSDCVAASSAAAERRALEHMARIAKAVIRPGSFGLDRALAEAGERHA